MTGTRPNIVVIFTDQQQADAMSCAGNPDLHTPNIDRLAASGVRYTRAYSTFPLCGPCRCSWMTGKYPHQIGAMTNGTGIQESERPRSLGFRLREAGYTPAYGGKWHVGSIDLADGRAAQFGFEYTCGFNDELLPGQTAKFISRQHDKPFCLFASFDNPHNICEHSRDQHLAWGTPPLGDPREHPNRPANYAPTAFESRMLAAHRTGIQTTYSEERWREYRHVYYRLCEQVDRQIGEILGAIDQTANRDNTVVIFMADHGDMAGSHGFVQKSMLYEESVRVPCIVADPRKPQTHGTTSPALINTGIDLLPTLLDLAGIAPDASLPGQSIVSPVDRSNIVCESRFDKAEFQSRMVRSDRYKYILHDRYRYPEMLFDMEADPGEMINLAVEKRHDATLAEHRKWLAEWCKATDDAFATHYSHLRAAILPGYGFQDVPPRTGALP